MARRSSVHDDRRLSLPHPFRSALPVLLLAPLVLTLWAAGVAGPPVAGAVAGVIVVAGAVRLTLSQRDLAQLRRVADAQLRMYRYPPEAALASWRRAELTSWRKRRQLARALDGIRRDLSQSRLPGASPLNRVAARRYADLFPLLAERLRNPRSLVPAVGVLEVEDLLHDPDGPLYARERERELGVALTRCLAALAAEEARR
jgi:hypothetical protein